MGASIQRLAGSRTLRAAVVAILVAGGALVRPAAHEIPASATVRLFARPDGQRFRLLVRVPLVSMRDFVFPVRPGDLLDLPAVRPQLPPAALTWLAPSLTLFEEGRRLDPPELVAVRLSLPSDTAFESFESAVAHFGAPPLPAETALPLASAQLDAMFEYQIASDGSRFAIAADVARLGLRVSTQIRFEPPGQPERVFQFTGDPGLVRLDPRWHQAALTFTRLGFEHILDGIDHLLFLFCLVLPLRRFGHLVMVVTAFTVAHSITLFAAAFGYQPSALWFPPLVETLIAASIVYMALENIVVAARTAGGTRIAPGAVHGRWLIAFVFGLVHGFGFSFALQDTLQLAGSHVVTSLFAFNAGVELGQLLVLTVLVPALAVCFRFLDERLGVIIASALVVHTAWHWMVDRGAALAEYDWSVTNPVALARTLWILTVTVAVAGTIWLVRTYRQDRRGRRP